MHILITPTWYPHDEDDIDLEKTKRLSDAGWNVIRVRERPLKKISPYNIVFRTNEIKQASNKLLSKLDESYDIEISNLQRYLKRKTLVNQKAADIYIDKLLANNK